jgi:hypothetical protein
MPPVEHAHSLVRWLNEIGLCGQGAMGPVPIGWTDLAHWMRLTGAPAQPWQLRALRQASAAYVGQLHDATEPDCPPPWSEAGLDDRERVARQVREVFGSRKRAAKPDDAVRAPT